MTTTTTKCKFRYYSRIRGYADNKMIKVSHELNDSAIDDAVYEMQYETEGRYTYNAFYFFFEHDTDALLFRLKYGK